MKISKPNILYVCSKNKWRSRTAETIFSNNKRIIVKSAGTQSSAVVQINTKLIEWSDAIHVMEHKHKKYIIDQFRSKIDLPEIIVLEISDEYQYMDSELIEMLTNSLNDYLEI